MLTILNQEKSKIVVNRSKFLGFIFPCNSIENRSVLLESIGKEYYMATHICFAHVFWDGKSISYFSSDDREPTGTAGLQILNALRENDLINVLCVVVRFFGGVKLGVQNLSKAYKQCALDAIVQAQKLEVSLKTKCIIKCDYNIFNKLNKFLPKLKSNITNFDNKISIEIMLSDEEISRVEKIVTEFTKLKETSFC